MALTFPETALAPLAITLFGPMQTLAGGRPLPRLRSRKSLWLLALLALRGGQAVEREWLAGTLWPDSDPDQALSGLRSTLSELRNALGTAGGRLQSSSRHLLRLDITDAEVDVLAFDRAVKSGKPSALEQAVALYRGPLLEGCTEEWAPQERDAREQDCLRALMTLADAALAAGDGEASARYYQRAVILDPWRDSARRGLMEALARGGDTNAALQVYREFTALLREDPRAAPDEQTSALYTRLRAQSHRRIPTPLKAVKAVAAGQARRKQPGEAASTAVKGYLPHPLTDLVGRDEESDEVAGRLRQSRLVTLTGPGGIGKTRLALAVAREVAPEFAGGVWLVALETVSDSGLVVPQIAGLLGVKEEVGRTLLASLTDHLRAKRVLLVLDNCEHLLEASAQVVGHLLRECAGVHVLATSRESLRVMGEVSWAVPALAVPDPAHLPAAGASLLPVLAGYEGVRLFVERAQAVQQTFALTADNARAVAEVCARLRGIPLALELAAARVRAMTVEQMTARLDDHLGLLTDGSRAAPSRQQTLRATLDWSHALLTIPEQLVLARASVFADSWSLEAAEAVCSGEGISSRQILDLLTGLVDKSLVAFDPQDSQTCPQQTGRQSTETGRQSTGSGRYSLLEMVRQYGAERLGESRAKASSRSRHRDWFLALAEEAEPQLMGPEQAAGLMRLEADWGNLRAALAGCGTEAQSADPKAAKAVAESGLRLAAALWRFWELRGYYSEGRAALREALGRNGARERTSGRAKALNAAGVLAFYQGDYGAAQALQEESLAVSREIGDKPGSACSLKDLGKLAGVQGDHRTAKALYEESLALNREVEDKQACAELLNDLGSLAIERGDTGAARALHEQSLAISRGLADTQAVAWALLHLGGIANLAGDYGTARLLYGECLAIFQEQANKQGIAWALGGLGKAAFQQADYPAAEALYHESLSVFRDLGNKHGAAWSLGNLGTAALHEGRLMPARELFEESLRLFQTLGNRMGIAWSLNHLGDVAHGFGEEGTARGLFEESLSLFRELEDKEGVAETLRDLAAVSAAQGAGARGLPVGGAG